MVAMDVVPSFKKRMISLEGSKRGFRVMGGAPKNCSKNWVRGAVWASVALWAWTVSIARGLTNDSNLIVLSGTMRWDQKESLIPRDVD
jgi:hypothetical protein